MLSTLLADIVAERERNEITNFNFILKILTGKNFILHKNF